MLQMQTVLLKHGTHMLQMQTVLYLLRKLEQVETC